MRIKLYKKTLLPLLILPLIGFSSAFSQQFGKNKVQYDFLKWNLIQTAHFDIYFSEGGHDIAEFTAREAEKAYSYITETFRWQLPEGDRLYVITYNSHNDFAQTNVTTGDIGEGTGGFTEFFKNRAVVPYTGSWEEFRHVIHHELTHAVMLRMIYGGGVQSILTGLSRLPIPLWFIEGLAEYESRFGMDTESDMYIRDMVVNSYLPDLEYLNYYGFQGVYKGGQSFIYFISQTYGDEKVGELLHRIKNSRDVTHGFKDALGVDMKELNRRWQQFVTKSPWQVGAVTEQPMDFAEKLTEHDETYAYITSPAISPLGDKLVFISNRSDYFDIYLYSLVDKKVIKKLVSGQRTKAFEDLHVTRPGISWSPDGGRIVFASKAGGQDALTIVDSEKGKIQRTISFDLDGIYSPSWCPKGDEIAFMGIKEGKCDIYLINLDDGGLSQVTDDVFSDFEPSWPPDGNTIIFTSDRGDYVHPKLEIQDYSLANHDYSNYDIYSAERTSGWKITRLLATPDNEKTPVMAGEEDIIYVSDANGIFNFYRLNLPTGDTYPITNVITGCFQPSVSSDGKKLAFVCYYNAGYDVFLMDNPLNPDLKKEMKLTPLKERLNARGVIEPPVGFQGAVNLKSYNADDRPYQNYVFDFNRRRNDITEETESAEVDTASFRTPEGSYAVKKYQVKFTADYVFASAYFSSVWGARGLAVAHFSDILGNHNLTLLTDLQGRIDVSNALVQYLYMGYRIGIGAQAFHWVNYFSDYDLYYLERTYFRDRNYGLGVNLTYPLSKFDRFELDADFISIDRDTATAYFAEYGSFEHRRIILPQLSYVHDTVVWGNTGPMNGGRSYISYRISPDLLPNASPNANTQGLDFQTVTADYRRYFRMGNDYSFALRFTGGASFGHNPQQFFLGGVYNWINLRYSGGVRIKYIEDIYFSDFIAPFRGGSVYEKDGDRFFLTNLEFRFPLIRYLLFGWPLPIYFYNIRGSFFTDLGSAWDNDPAPPIKLVMKKKDGKYLEEGILMGYGWGVRLNLGYFLVKWDVAWQTDMGNHSKPKFYLSLGSEF